MHHNISIIIHPPINSSKRAWKNGILKKEKEYLDRNHDIVDCSDILITCPKEDVEQLRSGTWATIRYAKKSNKKTIIIYPSGIYWK